MKKIFIFIIGFIIISAPFAVSAAGVVPDCGKINPTTHVIDTPCDFNMVMKLINNIINFLLVVVASPLAAIAIAYAGFLMISAGGSSEKVTKAKGILKNIVIGYVIALAAWLIVHTILSALGFNGPMFLSS